jgi:tetratricopeptide (TPR) repeat protein
VRNLPKAHLYPVTRTHFLKCCVVLLGIAFLTQAKATAGVFDTLQTIADSSRLGQAEEIYIKKIRPYKDSVYAYAQINSLIALAAKIHSHGLECYGWSMLADHIARLNGFNATSTKIHLNSIELAKNYGLPLLEGICSYKTGRYFYSFKKYPSAFEYLLKANDIFIEIGYNHVPLASDFLYYLGSIYYESGDFDKAAFFFDKCLTQQHIDSWQILQANNTLGVIERNKKNYSLALAFMQKVFGLASSKKDSVWVGLSSGSIGDVYFAMGNYTQAIPFLQTGSRLMLHMVNIQTL